MPTTRNHGTFHAIQLSKDREKKNREKEREKTNSHHGENPLVPRLGVEANHSSSGMTANGEEQPSVVCSEQKKTHWYQNKVQELFFHILRLSSREIRS